jgi:hypothetical protein
LQNANLKRLDFLKLEASVAKQLVFPEYLSSFDALQQHFRGQLEGLSTTEKGRRFAHFVQKLIPQTEVGGNFDLPTLSERISGDGGVDLTAQSKVNGEQLYIQSKLWVDRADDIDSVISKFQAYTVTEHGVQPPLFEDTSSKFRFALVTLSPLAGIIDRYKKKGFASKGFYRQCVSEGRIHFIDGHEILQILMATYSKLRHIPTDLELNFETPYIQLDDVYISILSSVELKSLYAKYGDALFFENVRDFRGLQTTEKLGRTTPNQEIVKTITNSPDKLLSRNNGLVFRAEKVQPGSNSHQLLLSSGSVVNGCQTTMCIVEYADQPSSSVLVKVVQTDDAWDITKSANYQTAIPDIDLELARYLRPQLVKRAASHWGVQIEDVGKSAFQVIDEIYDRKIAYNETRLLYVGLFSRSPNNVFASNYTELIADLIKRVYQEPSYEEDIFETLFLLQGAAQIGLQESKNTFKDPSYAEMFERLYKDDSLSYRCFLSILALCGAVNINISDRLSDMTKEYERVRVFLSEAHNLLKSQAGVFTRFYKLAVKLWMQEMLIDDDEVQVRRDMSIRSKRANFTTMFRKIRMEADLGL